MNIINFLQTSNIQNLRNTPKFATNPVIFKGKNNKDIFTKSAPEKTTDASETRKKNAKEKHKENLELYHQKLEEHPSIAFLYNPDLSMAERKRMAEKSDTILNFSRLAEHLGVSTSLVSSWAREGLIDFEQIEQLTDSKFADIETERNKEFLEKIKSRMPHSMSGEELQVKYNFTEGTIKCNIKSGKMNVLGFDGIPSNIGPGYALFDMEDETNKKVVEEYVKMTPQPSKQYFKKIQCYGQENAQMVPVQYLQKLGYGKATALATFIKRGELAGEIIKLPAKEGEKPKFRVLADISKYVKGEEILKELRDLNPDAESISGLAKSLDVRVSDIKDAILNDELEIIKEYIFADDRGNVYIDKTNPKNAKFIDKKLFEKEIIKEQKAQHLAELKAKRSKEKDPVRSLRAKIVWSMCPKTRDAASLEAKMDGYASSLLAKEAEGEELNNMENAKLNSYRKKFWDRAGSEEYSKAHAKAREILANLCDNGLDGVKDEQTRAVIEEFMEEHSLNSNQIRRMI